ncbi:MAG: hypothetical protein ABH859_00350 [Pseudomonadota bacterium]
MKVLFSPNTMDGKRCYQAALAMVLNTFRPETKVYPSDLDEVTNHTPGKWTWPTAGMLWLLDNGFELRLIEDFDYEEFARRGPDYIIDKAGPEVGEAQIRNSLIDQELDYARKFAKLNLVEKRLPCFKDIRQLLAEGYLVLCNVNSAALHGQPGYAGHFVVIFEIDDQNLTMHDPGLPPRPGLKVSREIFEKAWAYPSENEKNLLAVRLKK